MTDRTEAERIAAAMTWEQMEWLLAMPDIPVSVTPEDWDAMPALFVQFSADEFCHETGCYLGGGERHWFAAAQSTYHGDGGPWMFSAWITERGRAVRAILQEQSND